MAVTIKRLGELFLFSEPMPVMIEGCCPDPRRMCEVCAKAAIEVRRLGITTTEDGRLDFSNAEDPADILLPRAEPLVENAARSVPDRDLESPSLLPPPAVLANSWKAEEATTDSDDEDDLLPPPLVLRW